VLLAKVETALQELIDRLIEIGRCCAMEMSVEKSKMVRISWKLSSILIMIDQKTFGESGVFQIDL